MHRCGWRMTIRTPGITSTIRTWTGDCGAWIKLEQRASLLDLDSALDQTYDPYAFIRNAWIQRREYQVRDGEMAEDNPDADLEAEPPPN